MIRDLKILMARFRGVGWKNLDQFDAANLKKLDESTFYDDQSCTRSEELKQMNFIRLLNNWNRMAQLILHNIEVFSENIKDLQPESH